MDIEMKKINKNGNYVVNDYLRVPNNNETRWDKIRLGIYNKTDGTCLGRTPFNWAKLGLFYMIFYAVLALLFATCYKVLIFSVDKPYNGKPKWTLWESVIGTNPGLGFRPMWVPFSNKRTSGWDELPAIQYNPTDPRQVEKWTDLLDTFFLDYTQQDKVPCTDTEKHDLCQVKLTDFGPCTTDKKYGYNTYQPCVFIKLNKIYGWEPEYTDPNDLPEKMPKQLKDVIGTQNSSTVWVSCESAHSNQSLGQLNYYPTERQGFPGYYYPYKNVPGYVSPLLAVQFVNPPNNTELKIVCRAWAKNIQYSSLMKDNSGIVRFRLKIQV